MTSVSPIYMELDLVIIVFADAVAPNSTGVGVTKANFLRSVIFLFFQHRQNTC